VSSDRKKNLPTRFDRFFGFFFASTHTMPERRFVPIEDVNHPRMRISNDRDLTFHVPSSFLDRHHSNERRSIHDAIYARAADDAHHVIEVLAPHLAEVAALKESVLLFQHHAECVHIDELVVKTEMQNMEDEMWQMERKVGDMESLHRVVKDMQRTIQLKQRLIDGFQLKLKEERETNMLQKKEIDSLNYMLTEATDAYTEEQQKVQKMLLEATEKIASQKDEIDSMLISNHVKDDRQAKSPTVTVPSAGRPTIGDRVQPTRYLHGSCMCGMIIQDDRSHIPYRLRLDDGIVTGWLRESDVRRIGAEAPPATMQKTQEAHVDKEDDPQAKSPTGVIPEVSKTCKAAAQNAANEHMMGGGGLDGAISGRGGEGLHQARSRLVGSNLDPLARFNSVYSNDGVEILDGEILEQMKAFKAQYPNHDIRIKSIGENMEVLLDMAIDDAIQVHSMTHAKTSMTRDDGKTPIAMDDVRLKIDTKWEQFMVDFDIPAKIQKALQSIVDEDVIPDDPILAIAEALIPDERYRPSVLHKRLMSAEEHYEKLRVHVLDIGKDNELLIHKYALELIKNEERYALELKKNEERYALELKKNEERYALELKKNEERLELKKNEERHDNMLRLNQLSAEYKEMKKTLADDKEKLHAVIAEKQDALDRQFAKIPECAICMEQGPFSWMYKGCKHISVCDACHASGKVKQCPMHDKKMVFSKTEKVYFAFGK
jgi:hypothetical protein